MAGQSLHVASRWLQPICLFLIFVANVERIAADDSNADAEFFETHIRPLLVEHCLECHGEKKQEGGLQLDSHETFIKGGDSGALIVPGRPEDSLLIRAVRYLDEPKMPPKQKLPEAEIALLTQWVERGAAWPASSAPTSVATTGFHVTPEQQTWWAFQPIQKSLPPAVKDDQWPRNEIDRFVLAELEARDLSPSPPAEKRTWLRRASYDLIGLPPTPDELDAFMADDSTAAFERVVDRLLDSPSYGQRWARHWLDVVRYADYHDGDPKARNPVCEPLEAWRYRDWVVDAFNRDLPFDQFITHQIAGDLLSSPDGSEPYADGLVATTFLVNGAWDRGDADKEKMVSDMVDDQIDTVGKAFLGLTLGCSRCHDHKFDPVAQSDYYALAGIFYSTRMLKELGTKGGEMTLQRRPLVPQEIVNEYETAVKKIAELNAGLAALDKQSPASPPDDPGRLALIEKRDQLQKYLPPEPPIALAVSEGGVPGGLFPGIQDVPIHIRGSYTRMGTVVPRRMPAFFAGDKQPLIEHGSGRRELAAWIASKNNPLTARVIVNRVWQSHFGAGLVRTPNNFGLLSEPPSQPALLDWLADRFMEDGWSLKKLHRRMMLSATWRQAGGSSAASSVDPENRWLGRFAARRLEAEAIRDAILSVNGTLDLTTGGPASADVSIPRRSLYVQTARWDRSNFATLFDASNPDASDEKRSVSTVAPQSLFLMNNSFTLEQATRLADRLDRDIPADIPNRTDAKIRHAWRLLFSRLPQSEELTIARELVGDAADQSGWNDFSHVLLCTNEFIYVD
jgi:cytochrome c553